MAPSDREPAITAAEAHAMLAPLVNLGFLRPSQIDAALERPLPERKAALQALLQQGLRTRQEQRKLCAECGRKEGKLKTCSKCSNIWYCSKECQVANWKGVHRQNCAALKMARACRENEAHRNEAEPEFERAYYENLAAHVREEGQSVMAWPAGKVPETWPDFFQVRGIERLCGGRAAENDDVPEGAVEVVMLVASALLHEGLTCALAAKRFGLLKGGDGKEGGAPATRRPFRLHILGAVETEEVRRLPLSMGELGRLLVPHFYAGLDVSLFGPQLAGSHPFPIPLDTDAAPHVTVCKRRGYYHDWAAAQPQGEAEEEKWKPDMVVAFNSGAHTLDTHYEVDGSQWTPTLALLAEKGWPVVLTCYDELEGEKTATFVGGGFALAWGPELNPLRSLVLDESEPPEAHRWGEVMMAGGGRGMAEGERAAAAQGVELNLATCNYTSSCSRVWLGLLGRGARASEGKEG